MGALSNSTSEKVHITVVPEVPESRIVFCGTPAFAAVILETLVRVQYRVVGCVTQPDRPSGRKQSIMESAVKAFAVTQHIPLLQPERIDDEALAAIAKWQPDLIVVVAYGRILPQKLLTLPKFGCVNIHASLLPRWRGASPIQNALLAGDAETGVSLMLLDEGLDTGPIIAQEKTEIYPDETRPELEARLADIGQQLLLVTLPAYVAGQCELVPQTTTGVTLCQLIEREDGHVIWSNDAETINNQFRALLPWPGIFTYWKRGDDLIRLILHRVSIVRQSPQIKKRIGEVFEIGESIGVQAGTGVILLSEVQREGKDRQQIKDFLAGHTDFLGSILQ